MKKTKYRWIIHVLFAIYMAVLFRLTILRDGFHFQNFMKYGINGGAFSIFLEGILQALFHLECIWGTAERRFFQRWDMAFCCRFS